MQAMYHTREPPRREKREKREGEGEGEEEEGRDCLLLFEAFVRRNSLLRISVSDFQVGFLSLNFI